jgi:hypothetical protein
MNCELEYQAWMLLDQLGSHPEIEERKRLIVNRTLQRIEQASHGPRIVSRRVIDLSELLSDPGTRRVSVKTLAVSAPRNGGSSQARQNTIEF